jgi:L-threonylcarbamoyladenylate synthase
VTEAAHQLAVAEAVSVLRRGGVVAAATESSFGLLASGVSSAALDLLFQIKPRDPARGVGVILPNVAAWVQLVAPPQPGLQRLADAFWPGPLTLVTEAALSVDSRLLVDGRIAARVPGPSPAAEIVAAFNGPLTATSANLTGEPPCISGEQVKRAFCGPLAADLLHLHPAEAPGGPPSTFVAFTGGELVVLRSGAISLSDLERAVCGEAVAESRRLLP